MAIYLSIYLSIYISIYLFIYLSETSFCHATILCPPWMMKCWLWLQLPAPFMCNWLLSPIPPQHHCRKCGGIFCGACSTKRFPLLDRGYSDPVRVCDMCYHILTKNSWIIQYIESSSLIFQTYWEFYKIVTVWNIFYHYLWIDVLIKEVLKIKKPAGIVLARLPLSPCPH